MSTALSLRSILERTSLPSNEARILMAFILNKHYQLPRSAVLSRDDLALHEVALKEWLELESKRLAGQPIAYLIGKKGFHNIELEVAPGVLIPRPETELLVEIGLQRLKQSDTSCKVLDLGTGSGAIALAIAHEHQNAVVTATDQSEEALAIAKRNAEILGLQSRIVFEQGSWYEALKPEHRFDIILSNPPYIAKEDSHLLLGDLRFEPLSALTDHAEGLNCLSTIISGAPAYLQQNGLIAVEHGYDQSDAVVALMQLAGFTKIQTHQDLAGHQRVVSAQK